MALSALRRLPLLLLLLVATLAPVIVAAPVARAADGTITGRIVGQNGADGIAGTPIILEIATVAGGKPEERTTTVRDDGSFRFEGFPYNANAVYLLRIVYDGGNYFREVVFPAGQTSADVGEIQVYRGTRDAGVIVFPRMNTIFSTFDQEDGAQAIETGAYRNESDRAYVGLPGATNAITLRFGLPQTASGVQPAEGLNRDTLVGLDEPPLAGFATIVAIPPGERQFAYIYRMDKRGDALDFDRVFPYRVELYTLYLPPRARLVGGGANVGLRDSGEQTLPNGQRFRVFTANNIPAGARLTARFDGLPSARGETNPLVPAMLVFALILGIGLIVVYGRNRRPLPVTAAASRQVRTVPANAAQGRANGAAKPVGNGRASRASDHPTSVADLEARREVLLLELVELDERHEAGELEDAEYRRLRKARKGDLVAVLRALGTPDAATVGDAPARRRP
jgi:hypothetical protein